MSNKHAKGKKRQLFGIKCRDCGITITKENAHFRGSSLHSRCLSCYKGDRYKYLISDAGLDSQFRMKFGITLAQYNEMSERQFHGCAICKQPCKSGNRLAVDHDHITGKLRDLLCQRCNVTLGWLGEDEDLIWNMLEYLKHHRIQVA